MARAVGAGGAGLGLEPDAAEVTATVAALTAAGTRPTLAVVVPTDDEATAWYVRSIERAAATAGITCRVDTLDHPYGDA
ncbi:MAG TPA: tetrahydrofolate dehydrogenase/cyclohydrolase catalytic domain-containing protein, partial [Pseudonocardiaceae bacterium]|nr:tetrahydrofolate dehydrogenase/cyclohydrolase catalytic domain-containing protein [Pseudonocardiaceae bacterium]